VFFGGEGVGGQGGECAREEGLAGLFVGVGGGDVGFVREKEGGEGASGWLVVFGQSVLLAPVWPEQWTRDGGSEECVCLSCHVTRGLVGRNINLCATTRKSGIDTCVLEA
jgi:hypothetical protein